MKKSINIICVLIFCVVAASVIVPIYQYGYYIGASINSSFKLAKEGKIDEMIIQDNTPIAVAFSPNINKITHAPDSIIDKVNGNRLPFTITQGSLFVPDKCIPQWYIIVSTICGIIIIVLAITILIKFIKLIVNINKDKVFEKRNVVLLRYLGGLLIIMTLIQITSGICGDIIVDALPYEFTGYDFNLFWQLPWNNLMLGLISLLMAQIWARGIQMREEQELTI